MLEEARMIATSENDNVIRTFLLDMKMKNIGGSIRNAAEHLFQ